MMIHPLSPGAEAPATPAAEALPQPDYLYALVAASPGGSVAYGNTPILTVVESAPSGQPQPVAVVKSSQWSMGFRRVAQHPMSRLIYGLSSAAALGISYSENKSIPWALLHGFIGPAYLFYVGWNRFTGKGSKSYEKYGEESHQCGRCGEVVANTDAYFVGDPREGADRTPLDTELEKIIAAGWGDEVLCPNCLATVLDSAPTPADANAPSGSQDWWGADVALDSFEAETQKQAWDAAGERQGVESVSQVWLEGSEPWAEGQRGRASGTGHFPQF